MEQLTTLDQFAGWLDTQAQRLASQNRGAGTFAEMQRATGLRAAEVLELGRWSKGPGGVYTVQLAKREALRSFQAEELPEAWRAYHADTGLRFTYKYETYERDLRAAGVLFTVQGAKKVSLSHAIRFYYIKALAAEGFSLQQIQGIMGHVNSNSTAYYIGAALSVQDAGPGVGG